MWRTGLVVAFAVSLSINVLGQQLSAGDRKILESARSRYYNLVSLGFQSTVCSVDFDFSTIPWIPIEDRESSYELLKATRFSLKLDGKNPSVAYVYASGTTDSDIQKAAPLANLLKSLAMGLFLTWPTKGLQGPIPPFDSQFESVAKTDDGYRLILKVAGGPVQVDMSKDYLVTRIVSVGGKIDERPVYTPTPDGLIFSGNHATDDSEQGGRVELQYELENTIVDGLRLPSSARLRVNQNIDVRFALADCSVEKATVIVVEPPAVKAPKQR